MLVTSALENMAISFTIDSGAGGGIFAPSLSIGSMFSAALGLLFHAAFPLVVGQPFAFALAGMG